MLCLTTKSAAAVRRPLDCLVGRFCFLAFKGWPHVTSVLTDLFVPYFNGTLHITECAAIDVHTRPGGGTNSGPEILEMAVLESYAPRWPEVKPGRPSG